MDFTELGAALPGVRLETPHYYQRICFPVLLVRFHSCEASGTSKLVAQILVGDDICSSATDLSFSYTVVAYVSAHQKSVQNNCNLTGNQKSHEKSLEPAVWFADYHLAANACRLP